MMVILEDTVDMIPQIESSVEIRQAAAILLNACRVMLKVDKYDPMNNPPRSDEIAALRQLAESVDFASRIEHLLEESERVEPFERLLERSGLVSAHCQSCRQEILIHAFDEARCTQCANRVGVQVESQAIK